MSQKYQKFDDESNDSKMSANGKTTSFNNNMSSTSLNKNHTVIGEPVIEISNEEGDVPNGGYELHSFNVSRREKVRRIVENVYFRLFGLLIIIVDLIILIVDLTTDNTTDEELVFNILSMVFGTYFVIEVSLRIYAKTMQIFFIDIFDTLDFAVIFVSYFVTIVYCFAEMSGFTRLVLFGRVVRIVRTVMLIRLFYTEPRNVRKGIRQKVSENKRRIRTSIFDLDLTYVTDQIIAMSFPSSGRMALYRNNIKDVAKYLDLNHGIESYKVYNLCAEKHYDTIHFHGRVVRFPIDDHNVPSLQQILDFCKDVDQWLKTSSNNLVAVHCLGGKGRTGTMVCSYMVFNNKFKTSKEALDFFAERRTDKSVGEKFQGVETPSQSRYVEYFTKIVTQMSANIPEPKLLRLKYIKISALIGVGVGNGSDIQCTISMNTDPIFTMDFGQQTNCQTDYDSVADHLSIEPINCPTLSGDIRLKFNCKTKSVPRAYEDCAFYFWFNTSFIDNNRLRLDRTQLDNPHKPKTWKIYRESFAIELNFD